MDGPDHRGDDLCRFDWGEPMNVAAIIVTKGDQDITPVLVSLPKEWEKIVWNNGGGRAWAGARTICDKDLHVYGRYAAIEYTDADLIYVQDDDCIVSDPQALVSQWVGTASLAGPVPADGSDLSNIKKGDHVVCNMPPEFRHDFYTEHALVGFGAVFHRDAPARAFTRARDAGLYVDVELANRTCDIVFTALTPRVLVDVPVENLPWAYHYDRMWRQPEHQAERVRMLDLVRQIA